MRAQSQRAADRCENAVEHVCKCRCGGKLHGAKRGNVRSLPFDDPHSPARNCPSCNGKGERVYIGGPELIRYKCEKCQGKGKVLPNEPKVSAVRLQSAQPK